MSLPINKVPAKLASTSSRGSNSDSSSLASSSSNLQNSRWVRQLDERLWRTIDFLNLSVMLFSMYTAVIIGILRHELLEQCPLYAKLYLRENATQFSSETIDQRSEWGSTNTCEFASFAYLSAFVLSFISLWIHVVFRRVLRTERLLRLPITISTFSFAIVVLVATAIGVDGVIKFCSRGQASICSSSGSVAFSKSRWKLISLPVGMNETFFEQSGTLTCFALLLNALARVIQLFAKPKKSPEALKLLLSVLMNSRQQEKRERDLSGPGSQASRSSFDRFDVPSSRPNPMNPNLYNRTVPSEIYPYYHPPVPQYRQLKKPSRFRRFCCPCLRPRRRFVNEPYRPFVLPEEHFHHPNAPRPHETAAANLCSQHSMQHHHPQQPAERTMPVDPPPPRTTIDQPSEGVFPGRRRSSVRFEGDPPLAPPPQPTNAVSVVSKNEPEPAAKEANEKAPEVEVVTKDNGLQRNVSFRNNEDDLWTTVTINAERSSPVQSSHFNRLTLANLSSIDTSLATTDNGITAIHITSTLIPLPSTETFQVPSPSSKTMSSFVPSRYRRSPAASTRSKLSARSYTPSSEEDSDLHHIKPVEEIQEIATNRYNYNDMSEALKSNVERLRKTFVESEQPPAHYDRPSNLRLNGANNLVRTSGLERRSSDC